MLVVDDEPDIAKSLVDLVEQGLGYTALSAFSGPDALLLLESLPAHQVSLVIADHRMVPMDGVSFLLKAKALVPDVPRVLFTAYADLEVALAAVNTARVARLLTKPAEPARLLAVVRELVESRMAGQQRGAALHRAARLDLGDGA